MYFLSLTLNLYLVSSQKDHDKRNRSRKNALEFLIWTFLASLFNLLFNVSFPLSFQIKQVSFTVFILLQILNMNKTEVTSVKLVLFKYVMSFETLTKVDRLIEFVRFGQVLSQRIVAKPNLILENVIEFKQTWGGVVIQNFTTNVH